jgi:hypothetical protein
MNTKTNDETFTEILAIVFKNNIETQKALMNNDENIYVNINKMLDNNGKMIEIISWLVTKIDTLNTKIEILKEEYKTLENQTEKRLIALETA